MSSAHPRTSMAVAILAGGSSSRMGQDKARIDIHGEPLIGRVATAVTAFGEPLVVVGGEPDLVQLVHDPSAQHVPDAYPGEGPLGGILTAFAAASEAERLLVVACDLPSLTSTSLEHLLAESISTDADVCVPLSEGRRQWHVAIWHRRAGSALIESFESGNRSVWRAASGLRQTLTVTTAGRDIVDLDTPADVANFGQKELQRPLSGPGVYHRPVQIPEISVDSLKELGESDAHVTVIDVREPHEYEAAHATGAILIPLGDIVQRKDELPDGPLHIICKSGGRSHTACEALAPLGYDVTNIAGGTDGWVASGYSVTTGSTPE